MTLISANALCTSRRSFSAPPYLKIVVEEFSKQREESPCRRDDYQSLTEGEREVPRFVAEGHNNGRIAELLNIATKTVETHRAHIVKRLNIHNLIELVIYAVKKGMVDGVRTVSRLLCCL
jgi:DNA-binding NarL/FixJ family response regulator